MLISIERTTTISKERRGVTKRDLTRSCEADTTNQRRKNKHKNRTGKGNLKLANSHKREEG